MDEIYDLVIIGGGINGTAIARDAAGRGLKVALFEQDDLASGTSSKSTKLIHGGLRYLESYEFRLVRKALSEREVILNIAPHLTSPMEFVLPRKFAIRPYWMLRLGLWFYDHLGKRKKLKGSSALNLNQHAYGEPLQSIKNGLSYSDCFVDDARLVVTNALSAKQLGAHIETHCKFLHAEQEQEHWLVSLENHDKKIKTRCLINATGPWIEKTADQFLQNHIHRIRLVQGSHIVIPKLYDGKQAYVLQNEDKRIVFVIPYNHDFSLIGTTDLPVDQMPEDTSIQDDEINYLCKIVNRYFKKQISPQDIIYKYWGVRPLQDEEDIDNPSKVSRDYKICIEDTKAPCVTILGGKVTTHRVLSEDVLDKIKHHFPKMKPSWTASKPLPGGDLDDIDIFTTKLHHQYPWLDEKQCQRYAHAYGTRAHELLKNITSIEQMGQHFGHHLYEHEVKFLMDTEWVRSVEDILWRRSKLGLVFSDEQVNGLKQYLNNIKESS